MRRHRRVRGAAWVLCHAMAVGSVAQPSVAAPTASDDPAATEGLESTAVPGVRIWIEPTALEGRRILGWVEDQARAALARREVPLGPEGMIHVTVRGEPYQYRVHFALLHRKRLLEQQPEVLVCDCGTDEMLERVGQAVEAGAERLAEVEWAEKEAEREAAGGSAASQAEGEGRPVPKRRLSGVGIAGVATGGIGVAGIVGGATMMALEPRPLSSAPSLERNWRLPGVVTLAAGGAVLAAGVSMLVVDLIQCRKANAPRRCEQRSRGLKLEVRPSFEANGGGVTVFGRF